MECCKKRLGDNLFAEPEDKSAQLLRTIKLTKNINYLTDMMPKPNYSPLKYKEERFKSLGTIEEESRNRNSPEYREEVRQKIKQAERIKRKLEALLEEKEKMELPRLNKSLDLQKRRHAESLELPPLPKRYVYA